MDGNNVLRFTPLDEAGGFRRAASEQDLSEIAADIFRNKAAG
jgi:hypothetical protein